MQAVKNSNKVFLKLFHVHGTESQDDFSYHPGNQERDGFGHIAFNTKDVYAACDRLESQGVTFKKKPNEGRMKGLAFAYDPDGYWVEIVTHGGDVSWDCENACYFNLSQTMIRVKDPQKSIEFYEKLGMKMVRVLKFNSFSLYYLSTLEYMGAGTEAPSLDAEDDNRAFMKALFNPVLELTHNHGTESDPDFKHYVGCEEGHKGFGSLGFLTADPMDVATTVLGNDSARMDTQTGCVTAYDPDGYIVNLL